MRTLAALLILTATPASLACGGESEPTATRAKPAAVTKAAPEPAELVKPSENAVADAAEEPNKETGEADAPEPGDYRHASFVPADTPAEHREAFLAMKQRKSDGAPLGGIGPHGIHLDNLVIGRDYVDGKCDPEANSFALAEVDRVHLCVRVVHGGEIADPLKVEWVREGKKPRSSDLTLKNPHAYLTHAWHPIKNYSQGSWTVTVTAADGTVLGSKTFEVVE